MPGEVQVSVRVSREARHKCAKKAACSAGSWIMDHGSLQRQTEAKCNQWKWKFMEILGDEKKG
jgi:hypothetical protein